MHYFTDEQERKMRVLRAKGVGSIRVANMLGVSVNQVKYYYRMHLKEEIVICCKNCGKEAVCIPTYKKKTFCCDKSRMEWWSKNNDKINRKTKTFICKSCGKEFLSYRKSAQYCSRQCSGKARRKVVTI